MKTKRNLMQLLTVAFMMFAALVRAQTTPSVLAFWQFNEQASGGVSSTNIGAILDSSGNGFNGTTTIPINYVAGSPAYGSTPALNFVMGNLNFVDVPDPTGAFVFAISQSFTLEAVVQTTDSGENGVGCIVGKVPASGSVSQWWWRINAGKSELAVRNSASQQIVFDSTVSVADGHWHHLAAVYDASAQLLRLYVDYVLNTNKAAVFSSGGTIGIQSQDVAIGAFPADNDRYFDGKIDFVRISSAALAPSQFIQPTPTNIVFSVSSGKLTLSWPQDYTGWTLQAQTNDLNHGLGTNWISVASSTATNQIIMPINPANPAVFYRLSLP
jgi:hypothetical protein